MFFSSIPTRIHPSLPALALKTKLQTRTNDKILLVFFTYIPDKFSGVLKLRNRVLYLWWGLLLLMVSLTSVPKSLHSKKANVMEGHHASQSGT
jgi:hypothetical protein